MSQIESECGTRVIDEARVPIGVVMMPQTSDSCGCVIEVHRISLEERGKLLQRLYRVLMACGCCTVGYKRFGARALEYSFEVELSAMMELYCGLAQTGLELTEASHRALTELCVLRSHERALRESRCMDPHVVKVRLRMSFVDPAEEIAVPGVVAASA